MRLNVSVQCLYASVVTRILQLVQVISQIKFLIPFMTNICIEFYLHSSCVLQN